MSSSAVQPEKPKSAAAGLDSDLSRSVLSATEAQIRGVVLLFPIALLSLGPHLALWGLPASAIPRSPLAAVLFVGVFALATILHEGLHGLGYVWGQAAWTDVRYGMHWKAFTPYASCQVPMRARAYRRAVALPALVLGVLPLGVGLATGYWLATFFGFLMLVAAAGDLVMLWILRVVPVGTWVQDHPREVGYVIVAGETASAPSPVSEEELVDPDATGPAISLGKVVRLSAIPLACLVAGLLLAVVLG